MESARGFLHGISPRDAVGYHAPESFSPTLINTSRGIRFIPSVTAAAFRLPYGDKLTAKAEGGFPADHRAPGIRRHALVGASVLGFHRVAYH